MKVYLISNPKRKGKVVTNASFDNCAFSNRYLIHVLLATHSEFIVVIANHCSECFLQLFEIISF